MSEVVCLCVYIKCQTCKISENPIEFCRLSANKEFISNVRPAKFREIPLKFADCLPTKNLYQMSDMQNFVDVQLKSWIFACPLVDCRLLIRKKKVYPIVFGYIESI